MDRFVKAAEFGALMGFAAIKTAGGLKGGLIGAGLGAGGSALYDYLRGAEDGKLMRALLGAGVGGTGGAVLGSLSGGAGGKKNSGGASQASGAEDVVRFPGGMDAGFPAALAGGTALGGGTYALGKRLQAPASGGKGRLGTALKVLSLPAGLFGALGTPRLLGLDSAPSK